MRSHEEERDEARAQLAAKDAEIAALRAENADLKISVVAFLAPWAVRYAKDFELDGLHPTHYDILEKFGARMVDFKRALAQPAPAKDPERKKKRSPSPKA
jgi:hypothetical protein